jgi:hypothetical protein
VDKLEWKACVTMVVSRKQSKFQDWLFFTDGVDFMACRPMGVKAHVSILTLSFNSKQTTSKDSTII